MDHLKQLQVLLRMNLKLIKSCNCRERPLSDFLLPLFAAIARKARLIEHEPCARTNRYTCAFAHIQIGTRVRLYTVYVMYMFTVEGEGGRG